MAKTPQTTVRPDSKGRITLGALAKGVSSYRVEQDANGRIILEPFTEIPLREQWLYRNKEAFDSVLRGIRDIEAGRVHSLGDFTQFAED